MKQAQSYSDGSVILAASSSVEDAISSARGRLADERGGQGKQKIISIRNLPRVGSEVVWYAPESDGLKSSSRKFRRDWW